MADFIGFKCDACGEVWDIDKRTRVYLRYEATQYCDLGTYKRDLCPRCVAPPFDWEPLRSKTRAKEPRQPEPTTAPVATTSALEAEARPPADDPADPYGRGFPRVSV